METLSNGTAARICLKRSGMVTLTCVAEWSNDLDHRPGAIGSRFGNEASSQGSVHPIVKRRVDAHHVIEELLTSSTVANVTMPAKD